MAKDDGLVRDWQMGSDGGGFTFELPGLGVEITIGVRRLSAHQKIRRANAELAAAVQSLAKLRKVYRVVVNQSGERTLVSRRGLRIKQRNRRPGVEPAASVIERFGGAKWLAEFLGVARGTVHGWRTKGVIPAAHQAAVLRMAKERGIRLTAKDLIKA